MKYKNVVWDWNGTLLDDAGISVATLNAMLARRGLPTITTERYREIFGFPVKGYYEHLGFDFRRDDWDGISREYVEESGRRVTFEYIMIKGLNDSLDCARELAESIRGTLGYVNLIPLNPVEEKPFERSPRRDVERFRDYLNAHGVKCTIRKEFGTDIDGACGQLRAKYERRRS